MSDDLDILVDNKSVLIVKGGTEISRQSFQAAAGLHNLTVTIKTVNGGGANRSVTLMDKNGKPVFTANLDYTGSPVGAEVFNKPFSCSKDVDPTAPDSCKNECVDIPVLLDKFKACCCCFDDAGYWKSSELVSPFVTVLCSDHANPATCLDPNKPTDLQTATDFWKDKGIDLTKANNFFYGMGAVVQYFLILYAPKKAGDPPAPDYSPILLCPWNGDPGKYYESIPKFYKCLYEFLKEIYQGEVVPQLADWKTFNDYCSELGCLSLRKNRVEVYLTYKWRSYVNFLVETPFNFIIQDDEAIQQLGQIVTHKSHVCQRFTFQEKDPDKGVMGWALTYCNANYRIINTEPDGVAFSVDGQSPMMFLGGQFRVHSRPRDAEGNPVISREQIAQWAVERAPGGEADPSLTKDFVLTPSVSYKALYIAIHEAGHSIDFYKGKQIDKTFGFSWDPDWLDIAGWTFNGKDYDLDVTKLGYPSDRPEREPPITGYGHTQPSEDFAEAWTGFIFNPKALEFWYPKRYSFFTSKVVPFLDRLTFTELDANPEVS